MPEWLKIGLPALIALIGTAITAAVAYRQWQRQQRNQREETFRNDRVAAYKEIWDLVEQLHITLRRGPFDGSAVEMKISDLNAALLTKGLYIDQQHRIEIDRYVRGLERFNTLVRGSGDPQLIGHWDSTAESLPPGSVEKAREIAEAHDETEWLRTTVVTHFREVLKGEAE